MAGLLDTSILIARERGRPLRARPDEAAISVITLAELSLGVLLAADPATRASRLRTLAYAENTFDAIPVDDAVARRFAEIVAQARLLGQRPSVLDGLIAATAAAHRLPVYTQDMGFTDIPGIEVVLV